MQGALFCHPFSPAYCEQTLNTLEGAYAITTTTSTTSTTSTTTAVPQPRSQAITSVALQQAALSHILNAEGEKLQKILSFEDLRTETILQANKSVESMVDAVSGLELILKQKLELFDDCLCDGDMP